VFFIDGITPYEMPMVNSANKVEMEYLPFTRDDDRDELFGLTERQWTLIVVVLGVLFFAVIIGGFIPRA